MNQPGSLTPQKKAPPRRLKHLYVLIGSSHPRAAHYLLQPDLLRLEEVQHPAAPNLREILPEVKSRVRVTEQAYLGHSLPLRWACRLLFLLFILLRGLLAGRGPINIALYFCILLPPGFNFLESWFISVFLIQEPWNQMELYWRHEKDFRGRSFGITKSRLWTLIKGRCSAYENTKKVRPTQVSEKALSLKKLSLSSFLGKDQHAWVFSFSTKNEEIPEQIQNPITKIYAFHTHT